MFLEWLTPQMIKRVDVIKGPISALSGDQNRAGSVNIETLDGGDVASSIGMDIASFDGMRQNLVLGGEYDGLQSLFIADTYKIIRGTPAGIAWASTHAGSGSQLRQHHRVIARHCACVV